MTQTNLLNKILHLVPNAKVVITTLDNQNNIDDGQIQFVALSGFLVGWKNNNTSICPTQAQLDAVLQSDADAAADVRRKVQRDAVYAQHLPTVALFKAYLNANPTATFSSYLDTLEQLQTNLKNQLI